MSDVVLAYDIRPKPGHYPSRRSSLQISPNPFHRFSVDQTVHVFFELYHLGLDENDIARFDVTYGVSSADERGVLDFLRRENPSLSVAAQYEETTPSPVVISGIDVSSLRPGDYTLTVRVHDRITGTNLSRQAPLELTLPDSD